MLAVGLGNVTACPAGRNQGRPQPRWWPKLRPALARQLAHFPADVDLPFLGAWIEQESDGRLALVSSLGEVGYFQVHPAEITDLAGRDADVEAIAQTIASDPAVSLRWGGRLLRYYADAVDRFGITPGTELYHGLLKLMHSSRPRGIRWLQHVTAYLGRNPISYEEFHKVADGLRTKRLRPAIDDSLPPSLSCAPVWLLQRRATMLSPGDDPNWPAMRRLLGVKYRAITDTMAAGAAATLLVTPGLSGSPGVALDRADNTGVGAVGLAVPRFVEPLERALAVSGWGRPRDHRDGTHEGLDFPAPTGTPVAAIASGIVTAVKTGTYAGLFVVVNHGDGWTSRSMHLSEALVRPGDVVRQGQTIGRVGSTGVQSSGPHLHLDLLLDPALLAAYAARFGTPAGGFGTRRAEGVNVPLEPVLPVRYAPAVVADARRNGIPVLGVRRFPWGPAFALVGAGALVGVVVWRRRRRR